MILELDRCELKEVVLMPYRTFFCSAEHDDTFRGLAFLSRGKKKETYSVTCA